jgi:hypothetical protein
LLRCYQEAQSGSSSSSCGNKGVDPKECNDPHLLLSAEIQQQEALLLEVL